MHHACPLWCQMHHSSNMKFHIHIVPTSSNFEDVSHPKTVDVSTPHLNTHRHLWEGLGSCHLLFSPLPKKHTCCTFSQSHMSARAHPRIGHEHPPRIASKAFTNELSPLEGPSLGFEWLGTLEIHNQDRTSFSATSSCKRSARKCALKEDPFTKASLADSLSTNAMALRPLRKRLQTNRATITAYSSTIAMTCLELAFHVVTRLGGT